MTVNASDLSCQALSLWINLDTDPITFHGEPVEGYHDEVARRTEDHINGCDLIGHRFDGRLTGPCSGCLAPDYPTINYGFGCWLCGNCQADLPGAAAAIAARSGDSPDALTRSALEVLNRYAARSL